MISSFQIKQLATSIGFHEVGITSFSGMEEGERALQEWVEEGRHGEMKYLEDFQLRKRRLLQEIPDVKSVIVLGVNYFQKQEARGMGQSEKLMGRVARYAWGKDYHHVIGKKHERLIEQMQKIVEAGSPRPCSGRGDLAPTFKSCIDTQPLPERFAAQRAGLGFVGKNTLLLSRKFGPWLFLSEIITNLELEEDHPVLADCGSCTHCQSECPTGALDKDYLIDARKCIAYLTIEHRGVIEKALRPAIKDWIFGCDACLDICPFSSKSKPSDWEEFQAERGAGPFISLAELMKIKSNREYENKFKGTPLVRASRKQMLRNACLVLANSGREDAVTLLEIALCDPSALVRMHAAWALGQFHHHEKAQHLLELRLEIESHPGVKTEILEVLAPTSNR